MIFTRVEQRVAGDINANELYRDAVGRYETGKCDYHELLALSTRVSLLLAAAGQADPGLISALSYDTIKMLSKDKLRMSRTVDAGAEKHEKLFKTEKYKSNELVDLHTNITISSKPKTDMPFKRGFLLSKETVTSTVTKAETIDMTSSTVESIHVSANDASSSELSIASVALVSKSSVDDNAVIAIKAVKSSQSDLLINVEVVPSKLSLVSSKSQLDANPVRSMVPYDITGKSESLYSEEVINDDDTYSCTESQLCEIEAVVNRVYYYQNFDDKYDQVQVSKINFDELYKSEDNDIVTEYILSDMRLNDSQERALCRSYNEQHKITTDNTAVYLAMNRANIESYGKRTTRQPWRRQQENVFFINDKDNCKFINVSEDLFFRTLQKNSFCAKLCVVKLLKRNLIEHLDMPEIERDKLLITKLAQSSNKRIDSAGEVMVNNDNKITTYISVIASADGKSSVVKLTTLVSDSIETIDPVLKYFRALEDHNKVVGYKLCDLIKNYENVTVQPNVKMKTLVSGQPGKTLKQNEAILTGKAKLYIMSTQYSQVNCELQAFTMTQYGNRDTVDNMSLQHACCDIYTYAFKVKSSDKSEILCSLNIHELLSLK